MILSTGISQNFTQNNYKCRFITFLIQYFVFDLIEQQLATIIIMIMRIGRFRLFPYVAEKRIMSPKGGNESCGRTCHIFV